MQSSCLPLLSQSSPRLRSRWCTKVGGHGETTPENVIVPHPTITKHTEDTIADTKSPQEILDEIYDNSPQPRPESEDTDDEKYGLLYRAVVLIIFVVYTFIMYKMAAGPEL